MQGSHVPLSSIFLEYRITAANATVEAADSLPATWPAPFTGSCLAAASGISLHPVGYLRYKDRGGPMAQGAQPCPKILHFATLSAVCGTETNRRPRNSCGAT